MFMAFFAPGTPSLWEDDDTHPLESDFLKLIFNFCTIDLQTEKAKNSFQEGHA